MRERRTDTRQLLQLTGRRVLTSTGPLIARCSPRDSVGCSWRDLERAGVTESDAAAGRRARAGRRADDREPRGERAARAESTAASWRVTERPLLSVPPSVCRPAATSRSNRRAEVRRTPPPTRATAMRNRSAWRSAAVAMTACYARWVRSALPERRGGQRKRAAGARGRGGQPCRCDWRATYGWGSQGPGARRLKGTEARTATACAQRSPLPFRSPVPFSRRSTSHVPYRPGPLLFPGPGPLASPAAPSRQSQRPTRPTRSSPSPPRAPNRRIT